jgi:hypothetical protein
MQTSLHAERDNQETTRVKLRGNFEPQTKKYKKRERERKREERCESEANATTHLINPTSIVKSLQLLIYTFFLKYNPSWK